jgi:glucose dehydrogenase
MRLNILAIAPILGLPSLSNCAPSADYSTDIDDLSLSTADLNPGDWLTDGKNYREDRHSSRNQLNKSLSITYD